MRNLYKTKTGIEIGCAYQKPLPQLNFDEEIIQRLLLGTGGPYRLSMTRYIMFLVVLFTTLALTLGSRQ
jgi:hypothetical protein